MELEEPQAHDLERVLERTACSINTISQLHPPRPRACAQTFSRSFSTAVLNASLSIPLPLTCESSSTIGFRTTNSVNAPV